MRQANGETKSHEIDTDTFVVVSNFNGHLLVHIRKCNGDQPIPAVIGVVREERKRYPQPWTHAHKKNKMCCNGGTTGQGVLYTIENNSNNELAIKVNMCLTR